MLAEYWIFLLFIHFCLALKAFFLMNSFWTLVYPKGSYIISPARPSVCALWSVNISETVHCFSQIFCSKLGHHKGTKVTESDFKKTSWRMKNGGKLWHFRCFLPMSFHPGIKILWNFIYVISLTVCNTPQKQYVWEKSCSGCIVGTRPLFLRLCQKWGSFISRDTSLSTSALCKDGYISSTSKLTILQYRNQLGEHPNFGLKAIGGLRVKKIILS